MILSPMEICARAAISHVKGGALLAYQPPLPTNVRGYDGNPVQTFARERRVELSYDEYPPLVVHAFISAEDKTFFSHGGIDYPGPGRRGVRLYGQERHRRRRAKGGSTITQQVAKYLLQGRAIRSRKIREAILAFRLESTLSKQQILELYLNHLPRPQRLWRAGGGARLFRQGRRELTLPEAAYLAVLPKAPSNYDPVRATERGARPAQLCAPRDGAQRLHHRGAARRAARRPLGTIRYGSNEKFRQQGGYFMEEVRRELIKRSARGRDGRTASMPAACGCAPRWCR
jgi:penicillin-binding protein 1A